MSWRVVLSRAIPFAVLCGVVAGAYFSREHWLPWLNFEKSGPSAAESNAASPANDRVILTDQTQANLALIAKPLKLQTYWKTIVVPGMVVDRPGQSDRSVVSPVTGVVQSIERVPGETVRPGDRLFTLRLLSESLHQTQTELFKSSQDIKLTEVLRNRLASSGGAVPESRVIDVDNQIARLNVAVRAYRQELLTRGLSSEQIAGVTEGKFVNEISIVVASHAASRPSLAMAGNNANFIPGPQPFFELQELKVELGQQVLAGQTLCLLANHQSLVIEGRAFRDETPLLERALRENWPVEVDFQEPPGSDWPPIGQAIHIEQLANTIDPINRTFAFLLPLENQLRTLDRDGRTQRLWRFRPGQRVRLHVPVEKLDNVFVVPADAVAFDGPEAFTFTQNVNTFIRKPIRIVLRDRQQIVVANDGGLLPGSFAVHTAAAQLNRMLKSQSSDVPKGFHIHADGSLHKNGEPE